MTEKKVKDNLQQEIVELPKKQNDPRDQNKTASLGDFEILEALCQEWAELKSVSKEHSAKRQTFATIWKWKERNKEVSALSWLLQMLEEEMELRAWAETDKLKATGVGEILCQKLEKFAQDPKKVKQGLMPRQ